MIAIREGAQDSINQVGQEITKRHASIQPTLTIRLGFPMRGDGEQGIGAAAVPAAFLHSREFAMSRGANRLSLGPIPKSDAVKLKITLPAELKAQLDA